MLSGDVVNSTTSGVNSHDVLGIIHDVSEETRSMDGRTKDYCRISHFCHTLLLVVVPTNFVVAY